MMAKRILRQVEYSSAPLQNLPGDDAGLKDWLDQLATGHGLRYALIHADDGVIWGEHGNAGWAWSGGEQAVLSPPLRRQTILQMRIFGEQSEALAWREGPALKGRIITDRIVKKGQPCFDEQQILWGRPEGEKEGEAMTRFTVMREGQQAMLHAPPAAIAKAGALVTRNYIGYDDDGCAFVKASRLVA